MVDFFFKFPTRIKPVCRSQQNAQIHWETASVWTPLIVTLSVLITHFWSWGYGGGDSLYNCHYWLVSIRLYFFSVCDPDIVIFYVTTVLMSHNYWTVNNFDQHFQFQHFTVLLSGQLSSKNYIYIPPDCGLPYYISRLIIVIYCIHI